MSTIEIPDADHWTLGPIKLDLTFDSKPMRDSLASVLAELENLAASGDALEYVVDLADGMIARANYKIAEARAPGSDGGVVETHREKLRYLPDLKELQTDLAALIVEIEALAA